MIFSVNKLWYALKLSMLQSPFPKLLEEGKKGKKSLFFPTLQEEERGKFWKFFLIVMLMNGYGVFHNTKFVFDKGKLSLKLWVTLFS